MDTETEKKPRVLRRNAVISVISLDIIFFCQMKRKLWEEEDNDGDEGHAEWKAFFWILITSVWYVMVWYVMVWLVFISVVLYTTCKTISDKSVYPLYCEILCHSLINGILMVAASAVINHVRCSNISVHSECALDGKKATTKKNRKRRKISPTNARKEIN